MNQKFDFNDIVIIPEVLSDIKSRKEINPYETNGNLPLITAPMDTVIDNIEDITSDDYKKLSKFLNNKINLCLPRKINDVTEGAIELIKNLGNKNNLVFTSLSLDEFKQEYLNPHDNYRDYDKCIDLICIDIANGHMNHLLEAVRKVKSIYKDEVQIMTGNIGNPETFKLFAEAGADYIRCGIGGGSGCLTTKQLGVGYPMASLIHEVYQIKKQYNLKTKIIADGGMKDYADFIKALALGADYVMSGGAFNKSLESAPDPLLFKYIPIKNYNFSKFLLKNKLPLYKSFRGMSTKEVQKKWGKEILTTSEGVVRKNKVEYTLEKWTRNFEDYLRSAMSYTNSRTLEEFQGSEFRLITQNSYKRFDK